MTLPSIPEQIAEVMYDEELQNMRKLDGWSVGTVVKRRPNGTEPVTLNDAWIELFDGNGRAGQYGGVRFMAITEDGEYEEAYAYGNKTASLGNEPCWYVDNVEFGVTDIPDPAPKTSRF